MVGCGRVAMIGDTVVGLIVGFTGGGGGVGCGSVGGEAGLGWIVVASAFSFSFCFLRCNRRRLAGFSVACMYVVDVCVGTVVDVCVGSVATLGSGGVSAMSEIGGSLSNPGGTGTVLGSVRLRKISANCCNAACSLSDSGESADAGCGCLSAVIRSLAAVMAASVEDAVGMLTLVGNHASVSVMRSALVSVAYTR